MMTYAGPALAQAALGQAQTRQLDIPAQALSTALTIFGDQTGIQITGDTSILDGRQSQAIKGAYGPAEGLSRILAGTGVTYRWVDGRSVMLERAPQAGGNAIQLSSVRVEGAGGAGMSAAPSLTSDPAATEGQRSYTATGPSSTATGLAMTLRETPQSVTIVTRQKMDDFGLQTLADVMDQTPGITMQREGDAVNFYSRGTSANLRIDGIRQITSGWAYLTGTVYGLGDMAEIDRIEVLKGASGLINGDGSYGGTINLIRKRATKAFQASAHATIGSWNSYRGDVDVSGPLNRQGSLRARAVAAWQSADSFRDRQSSKYATFYGTVEFEPTPNTLIDVGVSYKRQQEKGGAAVDPIMLYTSTGKALGLKPRSFNIAASWANYKQHQITVFGSVEQQLGHGWSAKVQAGSEKVRRPKSVFGDFDIYSDTIAYLTTYKDINQVNQNLDLTVKGPLTLLGRHHELLFGAGASRSQTALQRSSSKAVSLADLGATYADGGGVLPYPTDMDSWTYSGEHWATKRQYAYAAGRFDLADPIKVIAGVRLSNYDQDYVTIYSWYNSSLRERGVVTPYAGVTFDVTGSVSLYASYAKIFQAQTLRQANGSPLPPEEGVTYEVGAKGAFFGERLNASASYFWMQIDNAAQATTDKVTGTTSETAYRAVMGAKRSGYEIELSGQILPGWDSQGGFVFNYDTLNNVSSVLVRPRPRYQFKWNSSYRFEGGRLAGLAFGGGTRWQSRIATATGANSIAQAPYFVFDAFARYDLGRVKLGLNIDNLFDKSYFSSVVNQGSLLYTWGEPRSFKASIGYRF